MIPLMAAALYGLAGYQNNKNRERENARQDAEDAWKTKDRARKEAEWGEADQIKTDLKAAAAPVKLEEGAGGMVKPDTMDNRDVGLPENQALPNGGLMQGMFKVGNQSFSDKAQAEKAVVDYNAPEAVASRTVQAYRKNGQLDKAINMENAIMDRKAKQLGLSIDELKFADIQTNRALDSALKSGPTWYEGAAKFVTDTKRAGLDGVSVQPAVSADGKTVTMNAKMPDGSTVVAGTYPTDASGKLQFYQQFSSLPIEKRMDMMADKIRLDKEDSRWQQDFDLKKQKEKNDADYKKGMIGIYSARNAIAAGEAQQPSGINMDAIDKQLAPLFTREDPMTGGKGVDTEGLMAVRSLALRMPAARSGDATGAALQAHSIYGQALKKANGNHDKAMQIILAEINPAPQQSGKAQPQASSQAAAVQKTGPISRQPKDVLGDQKIGVLTPMSMLEESAKAGNKNAIAYLKRREEARREDAAAPRTAADYLN